MNDVEIRRITAVDDEAMGVSHATMDHFYIKEL